MQDPATEILLYKQRIVGLGYLAVAVLLPYWIFVWVGAIRLGWEVLWYLIPMVFMGGFALNYYLKIKTFLKKQKQ
jgi:hypothetical protein